jgi:uncharacterized protein HemY
LQRSTAIFDLFYILMLLGAAQMVGVFLEQTVGSALIEGGAVEVTTIISNVVISDVGAKQPKLGVNMS